MDGAMKSKCDKPLMINEKFVTSVHHLQMISRYHIYENRMQQSNWRERFHTGLVTKSLYILSVALMSLPWMC